MIGSASANTDAGIVLQFGEGEPVRLTNHDGHAVVEHSNDGYRLRRAGHNIDALPSVFRPPGDEVLTGYGVVSVKQSLELLLGGWHSSDSKMFRELASPLRSIGTGCEIVSSRSLGILTSGVGRL